MRAWIGGLLATIISSVAIWWLTEGLSPDRAESGFSFGYSGRSQPFFASGSTELADVSGRYYGTAGMEQSGPEGARRDYASVVMDIWPEAGGTFTGTFANADRAGIVYNIKGQVRGNTVTFEAHLPNS